MGEVLMRVMGEVRSVWVWACGCGAGGTSSGDGAAVEARGKAAAHVLANAGDDHHRANVGRATEAVYVGEPVAIWTELAEPSPGAS